MTEIAISVRGLRRSYGTKVAVAGLDLDVRRGEVFALLGPNGAGKTTTVEILEGYRRRDAGDVHVLGRDPAHPTRQWRCRIGIVLQSARDLSELTVEEVVRHFAGFYPAPRRWDEVIEQVGLTDQRRSRTRALSGGQRRRLDVALGIVGAPELLFLDEPTTGFDPTARRQAWEVVKNLGALGKTILLTTHYMEEAQVLADRVVVIAAGRIVAEGTPESIGGRAEGLVRIRFRLASQFLAAELPMPATPEGDGALVVETDDATTALARLTTWVLERGHRLEGLTVERPSLEDVYLNLTAEPSAEEAS